MLIGDGGKSEYHFIINGIPLKRGGGRRTWQSHHYCVFALNIILFSRVVAKCHSMSA